MKTTILSITSTLIIAFGAVAAFGISAPDNHLPEVPCTEVQVPEGNTLLLHTYAIGVQKYVWNGTEWGFTGPEANLYADANYRGKIGTHYGGPTWESNSGSYVIAARDNGCDLDPANTIALLLLRKVETGGDGIFNMVTYIQRLNTTGGVKPTLPGLYVGQEKRIPYTAEYYFYRAEAGQN
jgi:hypothetical protein